MELKFQTAMVEASEDITAEDITSEVVIEALQESVLQAALTETQSSLDKANQLLTAEQEALEVANTRIAELEAEMQELEDTPATTPAEINPKSDGGEPESIAEFANRNRGNTQAILAQALKDGLIK